MIICPYCGSDQTTCIDRATSEYKCRDCRETFREDELDFEELEQEDEETLGFLGEPDEEW